MTHSEVELLPPQTAPGVSVGEVPSYAAWPSNAHLILDVARLGYLGEYDDLVVDVTYGMGAWWRLYRPKFLTCYDLDPAKGPDNPDGRPVDFRHLPLAAESVTGAVCFDPPYKLNGTPTDEVDARYGVAGGYTSRDDRHALMVDGLTDCARVLAPGAFLLVKCQDQVNGGRVRWQTDLMTDTAYAAGLDKVDRFDMLGGRPQDPARGQQHARHNGSTLLIFARPPRRRRP